MPTLRVTLSSGETLQVEVKPETVVSFVTKTLDGRGRQVAEDSFAWTDVASIDTVKPAAVRAKRTP